MNTHSSSFISFVPLKDRTPIPQSLGDTGLEGRKEVRSLKELKMMGIGVVWIPFFLPLPSTLELVSVVGKQKI